MLSFIHYIWFKRQSAWLLAAPPGFDIWRRTGGDFSSPLCFQTDSGTHSISFKMSIGAFTGIKTAERRASHPLHGTVAENLRTLAYISPLSRKPITSGRHGPNGLNGKQLRVTHYVPRRALPCRPLVMGYSQYCFPLRPLGP